MVPELPGGRRAARQRHRARPGRRPRDHRQPRHRGRREAGRPRDLRRQERTAQGAELLSRQLEVLKVRERINTQVQEEMGRNQREYVLRQQLKAIKEELGELDDGGGDLDEFGEKIPRPRCPRRPRRSPSKQLDRLKGMQPSSAEYTVTRTYLEWLVDLPWSISTEDHIDIGGGPRVPRRGPLRPREGEEAHRRVHGRAQAQGRQEGPDPVPRRARPASARPRSARASRARSAASSCRISLGGVRDEAEIRGHRRTYVGSLPGRIIQGIKKAGTNNPVFVLDEIDKLGHDFRGDPVGAARGARPRAELDVQRPLPRGPFDLSKVMFIATANHLDPIPPALRDRLEIIELPGYTRQEKLQIARGVPGAQAARRARPRRREPSAPRSPTTRCSRSSTATRARPACATSSARSAASAAASRSRSPRASVGARGHGVARGPPVPRPASSSSRGRRSHQRARRRDRPGVDPGRRRHPVHRGDQDARQGRLTLTGQLGDVMKESASGAVGGCASRAAALGLDPGNFLENVDLHVHVPAGAMPKDGPSAGVTMFTRSRRC
jgi:ATP-dependent Lon protease